MIAIGTGIALASVVVLIIDVIGVYPAPASPNFKTLPAF